jgi:hypothetical protein
MQIVIRIDWSNDRPKAATAPNMAKTDPLRESIGSGFL